MSDALADLQRQMTAARWASGLVTATWPSKNACPTIRMSDTMSEPLPSPEIDLPLRRIGYTLTGQQPIPVHPMVPGVTLRGGLGYALRDVASQHGIPSRDVDALFAPEASNGKSMVRGYVVRGAHLPPDETVLAIEIILVGCLSQLEGVFDCAVAQLAATEELCNPRILHGLHNPPPCNPRFLHGLHNSPLPVSCATHDFYTGCTIHRLATHGFYTGCTTHRYR